MASYVFIDSRVQGFELLLAGLDPEAQIVLLDPTQDGLAQIAAAPMRPRPPTPYPTHRESYP